MTFSHIWWNLATFCILRHQIRKLRHFRHLLVSKSATFWWRDATNFYPPPELKRSHLAQNPPHLATLPITHFSLQWIGLLNHGLNGKSGELPPWPDARNWLFLSCAPILSTLLPIFFTLWSSIQRQWPVRITSCTRHSQNAGNFFRHTTSIKLCFITLCLEEILPI